LLAIDLQQVANINQTNPWGSVQLLSDINGQAFFNASQPSTASGLWVTDGTSDGTARLTEYGASDFANVNGTFFFEGFDPDHGQELWKSDGTAAGTSLIKEFKPGTGNSPLSEFVNLNGQLLFAHSSNLSRSNGTAAGTFHVKNVSGVISGMTLVGSSTAYFAVNHGSTAELYKTDGTQAGTVVVDNAASLGELENVNGTLFFVKNGELWKYSGAGPAEQVETGISPKELTNVDGTLFFKSGTAEIWKSDGTTDGTVFLNSAGDDAFGLVNMEGRLYFTGGFTVFDDGFELWTSDGTGAGTMQVKDINPGLHENPYNPPYGYPLYGDNSLPSNFTNLNGTVYFLADGGGARQLWTTDGTEEGTVLVENGNFTSLLNRQGTLLLSGELPDDQGVNLYNSDGSANAAVQIPRLGPPGPGSANPDPPIEVNGALYFAANDGVHGEELWKIVDGTASLVKDIRPGARGSGIQAVTNFQGTLFFRASNGTDGTVLWTSDGTAAGTVPLLDSDGNVVVRPSKFLAIGEQLFFTAFDEAGTELWRTDGTAAGTMRVEDIYPGAESSGYPRSSSPGNLVNLNGTLFFTAFDGVNGEELWQSDGSEAGTSLVVDLFPGIQATPPNYPNSSSPSSLTNVNGTLYFSAVDATGRGLWKSNGTEIGTQLIKGPVQGLTVAPFIGFEAVDDTLYFAGIDGDGDELWKSDGTALGTVQVKDVRDGSHGSEIAELINVNGTLFFSAQGDLPFRALYQSDGTTAGTIAVPNSASVIWPADYPAELVNFNGTLYFTATDFKHSRELWKLVPDGMVGISDFPGGVGTEPAGLVPIGDTLYFAVTTASAGRELWRATSVAPPSFTVSPGVLSASEGGPAVRLAPDAVVTVPATVSLGGTRLRFSISGNASTGDRLQTSLIWNSDQIRYLDKFVGRFTGGTGTQPLVIQLNQDATLDVVQAVIRSVSYRTLSESPSEAQRTITIALIDGEGLAAAPQTVQIDVHAVNDAPVLDNALDPTLVAIPEDVKTPASTLVSSLLTGAVTDVDAGALRGIAVTAASSFHGTWQYSLNGGATWQDMGSVSQTAARLLPGWGRVRFIPKADFHGTVNLFYRAWDQTNKQPGETMSVSGNAGGRRSLSTASESASLRVTPVNDAPVLSLSGAIGYVHNQPAVTLAPFASVSDVDSLNFDGGRLRVRITDGTSATNRLAIGGGFTVDASGNVLQGSTIIGKRVANGSGANELVITFNTNAPPAVVQQLVRAITFKTVGGAAGQRKVVFTVNDGDGGLSSEMVKTVNVT
jgi:ELWxxDGT repeat protein